jgi:hypothetical protein
MCACTTGTETTVTPSTLDAAEAVASLEDNSEETTPLLTALVVLMEMDSKTLAAATLMVTADSETPASEAMVETMLACVVVSKSPTLPATVAVTRTE